MNSYARLRPRAVQAPAKPVLFLHIPKTGGTSFVTALQNLFGDGRVVRLAMDDPDLQTHLDALSCAEGSDFACINGHLPAHIFTAALDRYEAFTLLRNPVHRVMSLFRFLRRHGAETLAGLGLRPGFSFDEFIDSAHPELYQQINNGMTRALCGLRDASESDSALFWNLDTAALDAACALLERIEFGLCEEMELTQDRLAARWGLPFAMPAMRLNSTSTGGEESAPRNIARIATRNQFDIALYESAAQRFHAQRPLIATLQRGDTVFAPAANAAVPLGDIPGRTGFHPYEDIGVAWLDGTGPACLHVRAPLASGRLVFEVYAVTPGYPAGDIVICLDGRQVPMQVTPGEPFWFTLASDTVAFEASSRPHELTIELPYAVPARHLDPGTADRRNLGAALASVMIAG